MKKYRNGKLSEDYYLLLHFNLTKLQLYKEEEKCIKNI